MVYNPYPLMFTVNALTINMEWISQFNNNDTSRDTFYLDHGKKIEVTTIFKKNWECITNYEKDDIIVIINGYKNNGR